VLHVRVDIPPVAEMLEALAEGLVLLDVELMAYADERGIELPELYESGIVYRREPAGREWWETASDLLGLLCPPNEKCGVTDRSGDCEDLAAYRAAELRYFDGEHAVVRIGRTDRGNFHCVVERADGTFEDPSLRLLEIESEKTGIPMEQLADRVTTDTRYTNG